MVVDVEWGVVTWSYDAEKVDAGLPSSGSPDRHGDCLKDT